VTKFLLQRQHSFNAAFPGQLG